MLGEQRKLIDIRAILFDVDGTLYRQGLLRAFMAAEFVGDALRSGSLKGRLSLVRTIRTFRSVREELRLAGEVSGSLEQLQFTATAERLGVDATFVRSVVKEWMFRRPTKHVRRARRDAVAALAVAAPKRGIRVGALSDYPSHDKLTALGIVDHFSLKLSTTDSDINAFKPHPKGFLRACQGWGLSSEEILYVGDRPEIDAAGAAAAGMRCVIVGGRSRDRAWNSQPDGHWALIEFDELSRALGVAS